MSYLWITAKKPIIWEEYRKNFEEKTKDGKIAIMERSALFIIGQIMFSIITTDEQALYANIILKKMRFRNNIFIDREQ